MSRTKTRQACSGGAPRLIERRMGAMIIPASPPCQRALRIVICWGIGQQTPPVGAALFITSVLAKTDILAITRANIPFIGVMIAILLLVILFPETIVLSVPRAFGL
jgi:C4-dicarboxylate transporter DctM subunit